jgi:hypothetical protein
VSIDEKAKGSQKEQSARFEKALRDMIDAGELSPTEAEEAFERWMTSIAHPAKVMRDD